MDLAKSSPPEITLIVSTFRSQTPQEVLAPPATAPPQTALNGRYPEILILY
jgi:hypothetical protein